MWEWVTKMESEIFLLAALAGILGFPLAVFGLWRNSRKNDENNENINKINNDPPPDEIDQAVVDKLVEVAKESGKLQQKSDEHEKLLYALARKYADNDPENFEAALAGLERALEVAYEESQKDRLPSNTDAAVSAVLKKMDALNKEGDLDAAQKALDAEVTTMEEEVARHEAGLAQLFEKGITQAILTRSPETAARYIWKIADNETTSPDERLARLREAQDEWYVRGRDKGLNFDLEVAIAINRRLLEEYTREREPLKWAATQNNLGIALQTLGERESGTQRLEEAVTAYRAALEEYTRERVPHNWAKIHNNLGTALQTLGERESGTHQVEEAVTAFHKALEE